MINSSSEPEVFQDFDQKDRSSAHERADCGGP